MANVKKWSFKRLRKESIEGADPGVGWGGGHSEPTEELSALLCYMCEQIDIALWVCIHAYI